MYYVVVRHRGGANKTRVGRNREQARRALRKIQVAVDDGDYEPQRNISFQEWADNWIRSLERKPTTIDSYRVTIAYAKERFSSKRVRGVRVDDIVEFSTWMRDRGLSPSTRARHLRVLHACFEAARHHDFTVRNPVKRLSPAQRPRAERKEAAYFENDELPRLFVELPHGVVRTICELALKTGLRQGEIIGLKWTDVDLGTATVRVRRSVTDGYVGATKTHERRDVDLMEDVVDLLGCWWGEVGSPVDTDSWVFPGSAKHGVVSPPTLLTHLYSAMRSAGVPRRGPTGENRTFHSFRHTFAKVALEQGASVTWLSRHLGHSSLKVTSDVYGHFERAERKRQTKRLEGAFTV